MYAHPGSTDDYGGHVDWETGEYHYHHGYSAHYHTGGVCPYDFVDNADHTNHGSSNSSRHNYNYGDRSEYVPATQYTLKPSPTLNNDMQNAKAKINWSKIEEIFVLGALFSVFPFIIYMFALSFFVKVYQSDHILRLPAIISFAGCSAARYYKIYNLDNVYKVYFFMAWMLVALLLYEYFLYIKARKKYINIYAGKDSHTLAGVPKGIIFIDIDTPHFIDDVTKEKYTVYVSSSYNKYHRKNCRYSKHPISCFTISENKLQPCQICKPEIPDLSWFYKYQEIEKIKKDYNIK